jgi:catechol 2,3-dioxygenase-like lactoylglutathione lyase family enzyme
VIKGLAHVCYVVSDLPASIHFYCDVLGFQRAFEFRREDGTHYGQYIQAGGRNFIELFVGQLAERVENQPYKHICLEVDEIESTVVELRAKGIEVTDPKLGADQSWQAWLADPDGNRIELHAYTAASWQAPWLA